MVSELWFYLTTVLICTGYALLIQTYPQWKIYFSIGLVGFIIGGAVLVYFDAKEREEDRTKIGQMERMLEALNLIRAKYSFYTLTTRDNTGVVHALERYNLASLPQKCFGFDISG